MISIIVPFYNTEKYIKKCLDSIKNQTFSDYECLMIDDGSTDNSRKIAEEYLSDSRFKLLGDKHIGFPLSKNLGLDNAKGEYICFVDSDDWIDPLFLETLFNNLIKTNTDISCCEWDTFIFIENPKNFEYQIIEKPDIIKNIFSEKKNLYMWNKLFKKELWENIRLNDMFCLSDLNILYNVIKRAKRVVSSNAVLYNHRLHKNNITSKAMQDKNYYMHRINIYLKMCYNILLDSNENDFIKEIFKKEYEYCLPHLTKEQIEKFNKDANVKILLY